MAASIYPDYPPSLTSEQEEYLLANVKDWSILHGLAVRPSNAFVPAETDPSRSLAVTAPSTLFPSLFPRACFDEARAIQTAYNELYAAIATNEGWLRGVVEELAEVDDFISNLWNVHLAVKKEGYVQNLSLGIFRSDYMVHEDPTNPQAKPEIKQVEFNTIASSFGGLAAKVSGLHSHLLAISAYPRMGHPVIKPASLPPNPSIDRIAGGLLTAHNAYGPSKSSPQLPLCVAFVVQHPENNVFDQQAIAWKLQSEHQIPIFRLPFFSVLAYTRVPPDNQSRPLVYIPPHSPSTPYEVTTLYFRAGYAPTEYISPDSWKARLHLERSAAIKCPSILTHLAGSKKVQQVLATPSSPTLDHFLSSTAFKHSIERIKATFTAIYPLDHSPAGQKAISIAKDPVKSRGYVLKPQREGGGNNIHGAKIPPFLASLGDDEKKYRGHILMELIEPPALTNTIFRNGEIQNGGVIGELGVYGVCLWRDGEKDAILENSEAGFLLRTKGRESEEGGVAAGFGSVDSRGRTSVTASIHDAVNSPETPPATHNKGRAVVRDIWGAYRHPERTPYSFQEKASRSSTSFACKLSGNLLDGTKLQPFSGLWNPVNSSNIPFQPPPTGSAGSVIHHDPTEAPADPPASSQPLEVLGLQPGLHLSQRSQSGLQAEVSHPSSNSSPNKPPSGPSDIHSGERPSPSTRRPLGIIGKPLPPLPTAIMSPAPSQVSDTPSKRPPTPAKDLEYGHPQTARASSPTLSKRSKPDDALPWNNSHPCFPLPNPHVPLSHPLHETTRIIRIPRDWMIVGDLAPTFSNTYPEILEPWIREADFRLLIKGINEGLIEAFSPYGWRAWLDLVLGVLTGWLWEDFGFAAVKARCRGVEDFIERRNVESRVGMEKEEAELVRAIPLRRTGYLCLDIQIPDPHVGLVESKAESVAGDGVAGDAVDGETGGAA